VVSAVDSFLAEAENGVHVPGGTLDLPSGTRIVVVGSLMAFVLILRPAGLTGGRELRLPRTLARRVLTKFSA
jgi:branched-chain amino acid transport system permease protein